MGVFWGGFEDAIAIASQYQKPYLLVLVFVSLFVYYTKRTIKKFVVLI